MAAVVRGSVREVVWRRRDKGQSWTHGENRASSSAQLEGVGSGGGVTAVRRSAVMSARLRAMSGGVMVVIMVGVLGGL